MHILPMNGASQHRPIQLLSRSLKKLLLPVILCWVNPAMAQTAVDSFKQFRSAFSTCEDLLRKGKTEKALGCYEALGTQYPGYIKSYIRLAELYYRKKDKDRILYFANKAIDTDPNEAYAPLSYLCNKMNSNGDEDLAMLIMNRLSVSDIERERLNRVEENKIRYTLKAGGQRGSAQGVELKNLGDSINTRENECLPTLSLDGHTLVFTRRQAGNEDFFISTKDSAGHWSKAKNLGYPPNTSMPDGAAMLSADGNYLFYTRCDLQSPDGIVGGGCDLVFSYREDSAWSSPQYFGFTINTTGYEGQPCISSDNSDLYFVSNREGGYGGMDIWVSHFENKYWSKPVNLGPTVNTPRNETSPFIHPDNETLYFASDGHPGLGGTDLFMSRRYRDGSWKRPVNLGAPINTENFDGSIVVNAKGTLGYCASDRADSKGGLDLYSFETYPGIQPIPTLCLKGYLLDKHTGQHITGRPIYFTNTFTQGPVGEQNSNEGDGSYAQALQLGRTYRMAVYEDGYRPYYKTLKLDHDSLPDLLYHDIKLRPPGLVDTLYRSTWCTDSSGNSLDSSSLAELDNLLARWPQWAADSSRILLFINSYYYSGDTITDSCFTQRVTQCLQRLDLVANRMTEQGIDCEALMPAVDMLIYNEEEKWYRELEVTVVEYY